MTRLNYFKIACVLSAFGIATATASHSQTFTKLVDFNDANGPDASRFILDFVMQYQRQTPAIAPRPRIAQGGG